MVSALAVAGLLERHKWMFTKRDGLEDTGNRHMGPSVAMST